MVAVLVLVGVLGDVLEGVLEGFLVGCAAAAPAARYLWRTPCVLLAMCLALRRETTCEGH